MNPSTECHGEPHRWLYIPALSPNDCCNRCGAVRAHVPGFPSLQEEIEQARATGGIPPLKRGA